MVKQIYSKIIVWVVSAVALAAAALGGYLILADAAPAFPLGHYYFLAGFFLIMYAIYLVMLTSSEKGIAQGRIDDRKVLNRLMIYKTVKILVSIIFVAVYVWNNRELKMPFLIAFLAYYLITIGLELYANAAFERRIKVLKQSALK